MKVADVRLSWTKSPSLDVAAVKLHLTVDGIASVTNLPPETEEFMLVLKAQQSVQAKVVTIDSEGLSGTSETYAFSMGDLETPVPASNLFHEIVAIRDQEN